MCLCVCLLVTFVSPAKTAEPIEMSPFGRMADVVPGNHVLDGIKIGRIHSQPGGVTSRRCGLLPSYSGHLLLLLLLSSSLSL